jgi:ELWxxDGT repeat protein
VEALEERQLLAAQLVAELNLTSHVEARPPSNLVVSGGKAFFWADSDLWVSDGTPAGTRALPAQVYYPTGLSNAVDANGTLFFAGGTYAPGGGELWRSDGTAAGTYQVKDVRPGGLTSDPRYLTNVNGTVYFVADRGDTHLELWKSNGTEAGTSLVRDIRPGPESGDPRSLTAVGNTLYFVADDGVHGYELWKSDGTAGGTVMVRDIVVGPGTSAPASLVNFNGTLFFTADDGFSGVELWRSDGTDAGTYRVKDIRPGQAGSAPTQLTVVNSTLFFTADDGAAGYELWKSDGTEAGTVMVRDVRAGSAATGMTNLTASGGRLYFSANDGVNGLELWKSDGTAAGTVMVRDLRPGAYWLSSGPSRLTDVGGTLYFTALTGEQGREWWKSDGTATGTTLVKDVNPGGAGSQASWMGQVAAVGSAVLFAAHDGHSFKLYRSDRFSGVTQPVAEVKRTDVPNGSNPSSPVYFNGTTLFSADDGIRGSELWKTDGTAAGTVLVKDILPGPAGSAPSMMTIAGSTLFFVAAGGLWATDGTAAGTRQAGPFNTSTPGPQLVAAGGRVFYRSADAAGEELWVSDGRAAYRVADIAPGAASSRIFEITAVGNLVYFVANDGFTGDELWRSDGTAGGTYRVRDIVPGAASSGPWELEAVGTTLFFRATDGTSGYELFKSDGTAAGTVLVKDIMPGPGNSGLGNFRSVNGVLLFTADGGVNGNELWRSDGTDEGTFELKDIYYGPRTSGIFQVVVAGNLIYFRAADDYGGYELWRSDGTWGGTYLVSDIKPGAESSTPTNLVMSGGTLFFTANAGNGYRLWQSDGTSPGTFPTPDANATVNPWTVVKAGSTLLFSADDGTRGYELWRAPFSAAPPPLSQRLVQGAETPPPLVTSNQVADPMSDPAQQAPAGYTGAGYPGTTGLALQGYARPGSPATPAVPAAGVTPQRTALADASASPTPVADLTAAPFTVYDGTLFSLRPQLASNGIRPLIVAYSAYTPDNDWEIIDEARVRALARHAVNYDSPLVFDIEHWPVDIRALSDGQVQQRMEYLMQVVDWAHDERPGLKVGFYGLMPLTDYWTPVGGAGTPQWQAANRRLQPLADRVDLLFPSLYTFYDDRGGWQVFAEANLREAARYGKPIVPFLWMNFHESEPDVAGGLVAPDFWKLQLQTVSRYTNQVVYWGGYGENWNDGAAWWSVTREFLSPKRLAAEIVNVTPDPRAAPLGQVTVRFTRPVTGFDLSDLTLSRQGGPNLLAGAPGVSLSTADNVTWTLAGLAALTAADGTYTVNLTGYATIRDAGGEALAAGASEAFRVDATSPVTAAGVFDHQSGRQIRFSFSRDVSSNLGPSDLILVNRTTSAAVPTVSAVLSYDAVTHVATFTLPDRLLNGDYRAVLRSTSVLDAGGVSMASDYLFDFYMLTGDVNRDRAVNGADFSILAGNFGKTGMTYAQGDLNGDGVINGADFALFSGNFGKALAAPLSLEAAPEPAPAPALQAPATDALPTIPTAPIHPPAIPPRRKISQPTPPKQPVPVKRRAAKAPAPKVLRKIGT